MLKSLNWREGNELSDFDDTLNISIIIFKDIVDLLGFLS